MYTILFMCMYSILYISEGAETRLQELNKSVDDNNTMIAGSATRCISCGQLGKQFSTREGRAIPRPVTHSGGRPVSSSMGTRGPTPLSASSVCDPFTASTPMRHGQLEAIEMNGRELSSSVSTDDLYTECDDNGVPYHPPSTLISPRSARSPPGTRLNPVTTDLVRKFKHNQSLRKLMNNNPLETKPTSNNSSIELSESTSGPAYLAQQQLTDRVSVSSSGTRGSTPLINLSSADSSGRGGGRGGRHHHHPMSQHHRHAKHSSSDHAPEATRCVYIMYTYMLIYTHIYILTNYLLYFSIQNTYFN